MPRKGKNKGYISRLNDIRTYNNKIKNVTVNSPSHGKTSDTWSGNSTTLRTKKTLSQDTVYTNTSCTTCKSITEKNSTCEKY